ncbi:hypothetical protein GGI24_003060 [Coemansia furcata]|nr:hypothetical protein GGI24_003060 [Coemansia furcata]
MRSAVATSSSCSAATMHAATGPDDSAPSTYAPGATSGSGGYRSRYTGLGLGGGVGGGGGGSSSYGSSSATVAGHHRATPLRSVTTAAVMMHHPNTGEHSSRMPLLLSPISATHLSHGINLAGIRRDVKEGPRRLPSISASLQVSNVVPYVGGDSVSPTDSIGTATCSPGGLGIFTTSNIQPLPSPMATPRPAMPLGFDGDSLSLLALAADRAQARTGGGAPPQSRIVSNSGHHPYSRPWKRGPSMRSVSLKQSEDVRQLGVLDQRLKLK